MFHGKNKTMSNPKRFTTPAEFVFGGKTIPAGSEVKQFETRNFGWTLWKSPSETKWHIARE